MAVSYYKIINGNRYDRQMLKVVEEAVAGKTDKLLSLENAKRLYKVVIDGNRITKIERETLEYIETNYTFIPKAEKWLKNQIAAWDKKKSKKKLFSFSELRILRSGPIVQPSKAGKKVKKKKPPKTKVTVDLRSIGKAPKRVDLPEVETKEDSPDILSEAPVEQTDQSIKTFAAVNVDTDTLPASEDAESDQEPLLPDLEQTEVSIDQTTAPSSDDFDESPSPASPPISPFADQPKPASRASSSIKAAAGKENKRRVEQASTDGVPSSKAPKQRPMQAGFNTWKWYAIVCLLLVPIAFFVGRGFEPVRYTLTDNAVLEEFADQLERKDRVIATLEAETKRLKKNLEDTNAAAQTVSTPQEIQKAETKKKISTALTDQLSDQFANNLIQFDKDKLWLTFMPSESYFYGGSSQLNPSLKKALRDFFPNFVETLLTFEDDISEIRFQGHASSDWRGARNNSEAYLKNLTLSSARAEAALKYCLGLKEVSKHKAWLEDRMVSSGFSDKKPVLTRDNAEDPVKSRRITISVGVATSNQ